MTTSQNTEQIILEAARRVFARKGFEGTRMQEIADEAGINKALLHYYFRSKEKMFELVFREVLSNLISGIRKMMSEDIPFFSKIEEFIDRYIDVLIHNPFIPGFIITEIHRDPQRILNFMLDQNIPMDFFIKGFQLEVEKGNIRQLDPRHIIVNMIGMCLFPFIAKPILQGILFRGNPEEYQAFLQERKQIVKDTIINSLKIN